MSSMFIEQAPSAIVGLLVAAKSSGRASGGYVKSMSVDVAVCAFWSSLPRLDHAGGDFRQQPWGVYHRDIVAVTGKTRNSYRLGCGFRYAKVVRDASNVFVGTKITDSGAARGQLRA